MKNKNYLLLVCFFLFSCTQKESIDYSMNMNDNYPLCTSLEKVTDKKADVILLLGQSNATGSSIVSYLEKNVTPEKFEEYTNGYENIRINYCLDDHNTSSNGQFVKVDLTCGATNGFFGPEVGMAEMLCQYTEDRDFFILKYTMSGYSLNYHWLEDTKRGTIYKPCLKFIRQYMDSILSAGYDARISSICWMQGESDTTEEKAKRYYKNQVAFASYLREDLKDYNKDPIYFIDAGISNSPYCEPGYPIVNQAKEKFSELFPYNLYFSTIDLGFTIDKEPEGDPDWGHYDSLCEIELGHQFAKRIVEHL